MDDLKRFPNLDVPQAAERLGVRPKTLRNWMCEGRGPAYFKVGGAVRFSSQDLERFLARCRIDRAGQL